MMNSRPTRFLLVEDNNAHAKLVMLQLQDAQANVTVERVSDGGEALDYLRGQGPFANREMPDVVLLDLRLPRVDGHEVLRQVKADQRLQVIPVVILTTSSAEADKKEAYKHHANSYVTKPLDFDQFQQMIESLKMYWSSWNQTLG